MVSTEKIVLAAKRYWTDLVLSKVIVKFESSILKSHPT